MIRSFSSRAEERRLGVAADGTADAARALVARKRQGTSLPVVPEVEQSRREQRQPTRLSGGVVDERVDECRLDRQPRPFGRPLDRATELARSHRPEQNLVRAEQVRELDVRRQTTEEVGAQREQDHRSTIGIPGSLDEHVDERPSLSFGDRRREQLLELVDGDDEPIVLRHPFDDVRELGRRPFAGAEEQLLPTIECR